MQKCFFNVHVYLMQIKNLFSIFEGSHFQSLMWALILPAIFFSSQLLAPNPQFNFSADLYNLYFPQFVEGYHLAKNGTFVGIDFLTNNGASAYFLRPNIPAFYPIYQLAYFLFSFETVEELARAFVVILYIHAVVAMYFCMRIGRNYFQMDSATSLLFGVLYFSAAAYSYPIAPFYFVASLFPLLLYFALKSVEETLWWRLVLYSFAFVLVFLSGYIPLDVNAVFLALLFPVIYFWPSSRDKIKPALLRYSRLLVTVGMASCVVLPLYLAVLQYNKLVPGIPEGAWYAAHELSYQSKDIFALISKAFVPSRQGGSEFPSVILGLGSVLLLLLAFSQRKKLVLSALEARLIAISTLIFSFYLILTFGQASGLPDLFYFIVPGVGKIHIYGRFLPIASFFFYLVVAIAFKQLVALRVGLPIGRVLVGLCLLLIAVHGYGQFSQPESIRPQFLTIELLMTGLMLVALSAQQRVYAYIGAIAIFFFIQSANFNSYTNSFNLTYLPPYKNTVVFSVERRDALRNYIKQHSDKELIKFADLTASIEKLNGVMANYPWLVQDTIKVSNYVGYELHTSIDRNYATYFWFGKTSITWLLRTEADFVIYDSAAWSVFAGELEPLINHDVPEFDIGYGYKAAKLKDVSGLVDYVAARNPGDFDNGIVRVFNASGTAAVSGFETDLASHVRFEVDSSLPVTVRYLLFPNKMMELRIDGERTDVTLKDGLLEFSLPAGRHKIEYRYKNVLHQIFVKEYFLYLFVLLGILGWRSWVVFPQLKIKKIAKG